MLLLFQLESRSLGFANTCTGPTLRQVNLSSYLNAYRIGTYWGLNGAGHIFYYLFTFLKLYQDQQKHLQLRKLAGPWKVHRKLIKRKFNHDLLCAKGPHGPNALQLLWILACRGIAFWFGKNRIQRGGRKRVDCDATNKTEQPSERFVFQAVLRS